MPTPVLVSSAATGPSTRNNASRTCHGLRVIYLVDLATLSLVVHSPPHHADLAVQPFDVPLAAAPDLNLHLMPWDPLYGPTNMYHQQDIHLTLSVHEEESKVGTQQSIAPLALVTSQPTLSCCQDDGALQAPGDAHESQVAHASVFQVFCTLC